MIIWRLTKSKTIPEAFNGQGAQKYGGRWNSAGTKIVYCASSTSLAILENLVHFDIDIAPPLVLYSADLKGLFVESNNLEDLISDPTRATLYGDEWVRSNRSVAIFVPSAIVPNEMNVLLNPDHPDFGSIAISLIGPFNIDQRLI